MAMFLPANVSWLQDYHERHPVVCPACSEDPGVAAELSVVAKSVERGTITLTCPVCHRCASNAGHDLAALYERVKRQFILC